MEKMNQEKMLAFLFQGVSRCKRVWMWVGGGGGVQMSCKERLNFQELVPV